jgi:hypothetical protein
MQLDDKLNFSGIISSAESVSDNERESVQDFLSP